jgi:hypothetical protein
LWQPPHDTSAIWAFWNDVVLARVAAATVPIWHVSHADGALTSLWQRKHGFMPTLWAPTAPLLIVWQSRQPAAAANGSACDILSPRSELLVVPDNDEA